MRTLIVRTKYKNYPIFIGNNLLHKFDKYQNKYLKNTNKILIITTRKIPKKYISRLKKNLKKIKTYTLYFPMVKRLKKYTYLIKITNLLSKNNFNRNDCIVATGGGVIGDLAGYAASIFKRGINLVQIPTTLLSQVDSSVGGKTAINNSLWKKYNWNILST